MQTLDITQSNIEKIGQLFPNCLTERIDENGKVEKVIDFDVLRQELSKDIVEGAQERYQFTWPDKKKAIRLANAPTTMTLRPCREDSVDFDNTENLYIEGDNLEVLKLLREDYLGKVKMIYIDPPYNTGNDFIYNDDFSQTAEDYSEVSGQTDNEGNRLFQNTEANGRFHTDWLNMLYPRLKIAKDLLSPDGVIFISISDVEIINLRKICDEIFGPNNCVAQIVWKNKYGAGGGTGGVASVHEYILIYSRCPIDNITCNLSEELQASYSQRDEKYSTRGGYTTQPLASTSKGARANLMYPIEYNGDIILPPKGGRWVWSKEKFDRAFANNEIVINKSSEGYSVRVKNYLYDESGRMRRGTQLSMITNVFNQAGSKEFAELMGDKRIFDFPKPTDLLKQLFSLEVNREDDAFILLDFFSGSASSAHAVLRLNAEDKGHRKFIMVQLPEETEPKSEAYKAGYKNICEIGKERIRRAGKKILSEIKTNTEVGGLFDAAEEESPKLDIGFRVLKLDSSNMEDVYYRPEESSESTLFEDNVKPDRTGEDLLFQVMLECNLPLSAKIQTEKVAGKEVFSVNNGYLIACFDEDVNEKVITAVAKRKPYYFIMRDKSLSSDNVADNFEQIFQAYSKGTIRRIL